MVGFKQNNYFCRKNTHNIFIEAIPKKLQNHASDFCLVSDDTRASGSLRSERLWKHPQSQL